MPAAIADPPPRKKFLVAKTFPGSGAVGSELEYDPNEVADHIRDGFLLEKTPKAENNAATQLGEVLANMVSKGILDAVAQVNNATKAHGIGRPDVSIPAKAWAEPKENKATFGEWLQTCGRAVSVTSNPQDAQLAQKMLQNERFYHTKSNPKFGEEFQQNAQQAAEIFRAQLLSKGMSHAEASDMVSKASAQSETIGALGGFTVPVQYSTEIIKLSDMYARVMPRCRRYTMTGLQMNVPAIDYSRGGAGVSPYLGGMNAQWIQDGQSFVQTNAYTREIIYKANILSGYAVANRTLLADNQVGLQEVLTELMAETIAFYFDYALINGSGVNQPLGILNAPATIAQVRQSSGAGAILTDMANMFGHLHPQGFSSAFWLVSPSAHATFITMNDASGRVVYQPVFPAQTGGPVTVECPYRILGMPVIVSQLPASSGTLGDVYLIDGQQMGVAMRADLELAVSEHVYFLNNQLTYRFLLRGDAQPRLNTYLTLANTDTVSPFVVRQ
jgi:HK97 family phage major capsid protein